MVILYKQWLHAVLLLQGVSGGGGAGVYFNTESPEIIINQLLLKTPRGP